MLFAEGEIFPIIKVYVLSVKESCKSLVSLDYRKGGIFLPPLERLYITFPKVVNDWFIFLSYLKWSIPISSLLLTFYDPAKSHRFNRAFLNIPRLSG